MLRGIVVAIGVSVMVLGGILPAHAEDRDKDDDDNKNGEHRAILNAVNSGNTAHEQLSSKITALSGGHQGILDAVNGGTNSSNASHGVSQSEHAAQSTAHATLQGEHATQNTAQDAAHTALSGKVEAVQAAVDALSGGGGQEGNHTLRWDQVLPAADRFVVLAGFNNEAVLDKETGLVWEQSPAATPATWGGVGGARFECTRRVTGGRKGWRLPSFTELSSLVDPSVAPGPTLPPGHPFSTALPVFYWSSSMDAGNHTAQGALILTGAWGVDFSKGEVGTLLKTFAGFVWCVRGGMNADQY
jgi:hypothetical protein